MAGAGYPAIDSTRMDARSHRDVGKSDELYAQRIAREVFPLEERQSHMPRLDQGIRAAQTILVSARDSTASEHTRAANALTARVRVNELGMGAHRARTEANRIGGLDAQVAENNRQSTELVEVREAVPLLKVEDFGAVTAATRLTVWSHLGRVRSEAANASLAGLNPLPTSSGNTIPHRFNRGGDVSLYGPLHVSAITDVTHGEYTREYARKREAEGL